MKFCLTCDTVHVPRCWKMTGLPSFPSRWSSWNGSSPEKSGSFMRRVRASKNTSCFMVCWLPLLDSSLWRSGTLTRSSKCVFICTEQAAATMWPPIFSLQLHLFVALRFSWTLLLGECGIKMREWLFSSTVPAGGQCCSATFAS